MDWVVGVAEICATSLLWWAGLAVVFLLLTRWMPCNPGRDWWRDRRAAVTDLAYWVVSPFLSLFGRVALLMVGAAVIYGRDVGVDEFAVRRWPLWAQCLAVLFLQDVAMYWIHRLFHTRVGWRIHAVHHSPEVLDWTSAMRTHPLNAVFEFALVDAAALLAGFDPVALAILAPLNTIYSAMVHANLNWTFGPFRYVLASPVFHRWHHTAEDEGLDRNFASTFPFLDLMFGTYYAPVGRRPEVYGTRETKLPAGFVAQTVYPARGAWTWAKRRPVRALAATAASVVLGWWAWHAVNDTLAASEQQVAQASPTPPGPLRLSSNVPPAPTTAVAVSAATRRVVTGAADGTVTIRDASTGREVGQHRHRARVNAVAVSPNGLLTVSAGGDGTARVFNCDTGLALRVLPHHGRNVMSVAVSDDGWAATGTADGTATVWNAAGYAARTRELGAGSLHAVAVADGGKVVVAARSSEVSVWDVAVDSLSVCRGPRDLVYCVAVRPDGGAVVGGDYQGRLFIWDKDIVEPRWSVASAHAGPVYTVGVPRDGNAVLTGGADRIVRKWDAGRGTMTEEHTGHATQVFAVSADAGSVLAAGKDASMSEWRTAGNRVVPAGATESRRE